MAPRGKTQQTNRAEQPVIDDGVDDMEALRAELAAERQRTAALRSRAEAAERRTTEYEQRLMTAEEREIHAAQREVETTLATIDREAASKEAEIERLVDEGGNGKEVARITRELARLEANKIQTENRKTWLQGEMTKASSRREGAAPAAATGDKLANGAPLSGFDEPTQQWFRNHPETFNDPAYLNRVIAYATAATNLEGLEAGTKDYYDYVDQRLAEESEGRADTRRAAREDDEDADNGRPSAESPYSNTDKPAEDLYTVEKPQRPAAGPGALSTVARPSQNTPTGSGGRRREPMLSASEKEAADELYGHMAPADRYTHYNRNKQFMASRSGSTAH